MKLNFLITVACFGCVLGLVFGESCTVDTDCTTTQCTTGNNVICQHPDGAGVVTDGGLCTCSDTGAGQCTHKEDCYGSNANLNCGDGARHCYDNTCICDRFPIGRRRELLLK